MDYLLGEKETPVGFEMTEINEVVICKGLICSTYLFKIKPEGT